VPSASIEQLVGGLYHSVVGTEQAGGFIEQYAERVGASTGAILIATELRTGRDHVLASARMDPAYRKSYEDYYGSVNVYIQRLRRNHLPPTVVPGTAICPEDELVRTEYYNDYMRPQGVHHSLGFAMPVGDAYIHLGATRRKSAGAFGNQETAVLGAVATHLGPALRLGQRFAGLQMRARVLGELVDGLPFGVFQLDAHGRVLEVNRRGAEIVRANDGLRMSAGVLSAALAAESFALQRLIGRATAAGRKEGPRPGGAMRVSRLSPRRAYSVFVSMFPTSSTLPGVSSPAAVVVVTDPEREPQCDASRLCQLFGLTPAEAKVCGVLLKGKSPKEAADELQITIGTVRTHLKRILSKTETSRQSDLIHVLLSAACFDSPA